ncbi:MAG: LTA synthase family protein, partial [Bacteroidetes bacterium]|nr:LTA synthase family protein [Bacteroidota bacterium]
RLGPGNSYMPFLDSLMGQSYVCTQAYANALHSAEGIPAVVAGLPSLMDEPISTSIYSTEHITSLPNVLKMKGYSSAFYHGGTNGTMSFDVFCADAGFDKYFGRTEYHNEDDYDGNWGIWDEPFLQYFADGIGKMQPPFFATVFTLSSHPPYKLPAQYEQVIPADSFPMHRSIAYTDMALRRFFEKAAHEPWYSNTLFVITADHCSPVAANKYYENNMGKYSIPIIYYAPGDTMLRGYNNELTQQIDILPSVLNYLGYSDPFFAFGNSVFNKEAKRFTINYISGSYQMVRENYLLQSVYTQPKALYAFPLDSLCKDNLIDTKKEETRQDLDYLKAFIQVYHSSVIHNQLWLGTKK